MSDDAIPPEEQELEEQTLEADDALDNDSEEEVADNESKSADDGKSTEKRLKDTQAAYTKKAQENAELRKKLDELEQLKGELRAIKEMKAEGKETQPEKNPFDFLDDEGSINNLLDDPKNVANLQKKTLATLVEILEKRDRHLENNFKKMLGSVASDEGRAIASKVAELRKDPDYSDFSDQQLSVLAKKTLKKATQSKDTFRGGIGGKGGARISGREESNSEAKEMFKRLYPDDKWED